MTIAVANFPTPPHSVEAEQCLIGAVLLDPKSWARIANRVGTVDFYRADHRVLWDAISDTLRAGLATDTTTLVARLERGGRLEAGGGREYIGRIAADTPSAANVESYAQIVREHAVKRRIGECGRRVSELERGEDSAAEALVQASRLVGELHGTARIGNGLVEARALVGDLVDELDRRRAGERGLAVGIPDFDSLTYGLDPGDLVVLAGRPGMGKTAVLVSIAMHVSRSSGVAVFSAEMPSRQIMRRAVALHSGVSQSSLRQPAGLDDDDWARIGEATGAIAARRLWIDDTAAPSLDHVRGEVLALATRSPIGLVMVDYVQLMQGEGSNRYEQLRDVAYGMKALAKEAQVPIIVLAQLNRGVEQRQRDDRRPRLSDLRDSGAIEEAADIIGLLYSEGYYTPDFEMPNVLECAIDKNRNGERGKCLWHFAGDTSRIGALDDAARAQYRRLQAKARGHDKDDLL